jgi:PAS domain S-box-containing protein
LAFALLLHRPLVELSPFLLFYAAVAVSSWFGGVSPGLLATALGALAADYYLFEPRHSFGMSQPEDLARLLLFVGVGVLIAWLNGQLLQAKALCELEAAAARRSESKARRLSEANLIGVFFSDLNGNVHGGNEEFLRLVGHTRDELALGQVNWLRITAPDHRHLDENALEELRRCRVCTPFEKDHVVRDGNRIPVLLGCAMLDDPPDEVAGFVLDLSDRKRAEREIRDQQERLAALSSELMMAEERERRRIAVVLHDSVGASLALAKMRLGALDPHSPAGLPAPETVQRVLELIDDALKRTRSLTSDISPPVLYELGLEAAIRWLADRFRQQHGLGVTVIAEGPEMKPLNDEARLVLFHAVRELLLNVVKHAGVNRCAVRLQRDADSIQVHVEDRGVGFDVEKLATYGTKGDGFGLFNISQRMKRIGGCMQIRALPGAGTAVTLTPARLWSCEPPVEEGITHERTNQTDARARGG